MINPKDGIPARCRHDQPPQSFACDAMSDASGDGLIHINVPVRASRHQHSQTAQDLNDCGPP
jgi:hypothetical protein